MLGLALKSNLVSTSAQSGLLEIGGGEPYLEVEHAGLGSVLELGAGALLVETVDLYCK